MTDSFFSAQVLIYILPVTVENVCCLTVVTVTRLVLNWSVGSTFVAMCVNSTSIRYRGYVFTEPLAQQRTIPLFFVAAGTSLPNRYPTMVVFVTVHTYIDYRPIYRRSQHRTYEVPRWLETGRKQNRIIEETESVWTIEGRREKKRAIWCREGTSILA
jgi:hypothetical protein